MLWTRYGSSLTRINSKLSPDDQMTSHSWALLISLQLSLSLYDSSDLIGSCVQTKVDSISSNYGRRSDWKLCFVLEVWTHLWPSANLLPAIMQLRYEVRPVLCCWWEHWTLDQWHASQQEIWVTNPLMPITEERKVMRCFWKWLDEVFKLAPFLDHSSPHCTSDVIAQMTALVIALNTSTLAWLPTVVAE